MTLIVSRGTGFWGPPMRLFRRAEIVRITLRRAGTQTSIRR
jgi:predicted MPP superfamily phosphohydrolase